MALITQYDPVVQSTAVKLDLGLTNNDPSAIYNSGQLSLDAMLGNVADTIIANNSNYTGFTRNQVM